MGENLFSFSVIGWVNFVAFSPDSTTVAYATHDSELNFADVSKVGGKSDKSMLLFNGNPLLQGNFVNSTTFIGCGFDKVPLLFKKNGASWSFVKHLDEGIKAVKQAAIQKGSFEQSQVFFKRNETQAATKLQDDVIMREMNTKHENYINCAKFVANGSKLCTSDVNGNFFFWETAAL
jgi:hypothetical protein